MYLSLGSNQGPRFSKLRAAVRELRRLPRTRIVGLSPIYRTSPVGTTGTFLNAAAAVRTKLSPMGLLAELKRIEASLGRRPSKRWSRRTMDLDVIEFGRRRLRTPWLTLPHPRAKARRFVLRPLADLGRKLPASARALAGQTVSLARAASWSGAAALALALPSTARSASSVTPMAGAAWGAGAAAMLAAAPLAGYFWGSPDQMTLADQWGYPFRLQTAHEPVDVRLDMVVFRMLWRLPNSDHFYMVVEPTLGEFLEPKGAGFGGSGILLNWQPLRAGPVRPYVEAGAGTLLADRYQHLDGPLNFELLVGAGVNVRLAQNWALYAGYRGQHFSNGGIYKPNIGINANMPVVGITWTH